MMKSPTLIFENSLVSLNQLEDNLFEPKDECLLVDIVSRSNKAFYNDFMKKDAITLVEQPREPNNGKLAVIVPFFHAYKGIEVMRENYRRFIGEIPVNKKDIFVIELTFGSSPFMIQESQDFMRIRGGENNLMWQKERLLNLALKNLPKDYSNVAWIDADILFENKNLVKDTKESLDKYCFAQLFDNAVWLTHRGEPKENFKSIVHRGGISVADRTVGAYGYHPGFAWAARREILDKVGLFDSHIAGNGDLFMFYSIVGNVNSSHYQMANKLIGFNYKFAKYRDKIKKLADGSIGNIPGNVSHLFHGEFKDRAYHARQDILMENNFDPQEHIIINKDGIFEWNLECPESVIMKEKLALYFRGK